MMPLTSEWFRRRLAMQANQISFVQLLPIAGLMLSASEPCHEHSPLTEAFVQLLPFAGLMLSASAPPHRQLPLAEARSVVTLMDAAEAAPHSGSDHCARHRGRKGIQLRRAGFGHLHSPCWKRDCLEVQKACYKLRKTSLRGSLANNTGRPGWYSVTHEAGIVSHTKLVWCHTLS